MNRLKKIFQYLRNPRWYKFKAEWRQNNLHNETTPSNFFDPNNVLVGKHVYGSLLVENDTNSKLIIGNFCSIAENVTFLVGLDHPTKHISTYPFKVKFLGQKKEAISKGNIVVSDDVWIGNGATILSGVNIGQGSIIASGAVVTKNVPPYSIVGGVPAQIIKYRFSSDIIQELLKIDYSKLTVDDIKAHQRELYENIESKDQARELIKWMPKK